ncbi:MAG: hypothetical protein JW769_05655 [Parachlamydiales bacterium]|nr:hypothetical protein [Parachlamydiales bacterium]
MKISIDKKMIPLSHKMGEQCIVPGTCWIASIFPTKLSLFHREALSSEEKLEFVWDLKGPFLKFTVFLDLEKQRIQVSGQTPEGWFRFSLKGSSDGFFLFFEKVPKKRCRYHYVSNMRVFPESQEAFIEEKNFLKIPMPLKSKIPSRFEKLFLGDNKSQEISSIYKRLDWREIFPLWFYQGQQVPKVCEEYFGTATLLASLEEEIRENHKKEAEKLFYALFVTSFQDLLVPHLIDEKFQGIVASQDILSQASPLIIVQRGYELIRSLFFQQKKEQFFLLPHLFSLFVSGRMIHICCDNLGFLDLQWSKSMIRKMIFYPLKDFEMRLHAPLVKKFRLKKSKKDRGEVLSIEKVIPIEKELVYFFDRFQK